MKFITTYEMLKMKKTTLITIRVVLLIAFVFGLVGQTASTVAAQAVDTATGNDCHGEPPTITYIGYDFIVSGTDGDDVIYIEGGWNFVYANGGHDKICVVGHFNNVHGGEGNDTVSADGLYNELFGNEGGDALHADIITNALNGDTNDLCNDSGC